MFKQLVNKDNEDIYPLLSSQHETIPDWFIIYQDTLDSDQTYTSPLGNKYTVKRGDIGARISEVTTAREIKVITSNQLKVSSDGFAPGIYGSNSVYVHCPYAISSGSTKHVNYYSTTGLPSSTLASGSTIAVVAEYTAHRIPKKDGSTDWVLQGHLSGGNCLYCATFNIYCHNNAGNNQMPRLTIGNSQTVNKGFCMFEILEEVDE